jgi:hypothetical protein
LGRQVKDVAMSDDDPEFMEDDDEAEDDDELED